MYHILLQLLTGSDNKTHDLRPWLALVSCLIGFGLEIYSVGWKNHPFDIQNFGIGVGALLAGYGAAMKLGGDPTFLSNLAQLQPDHSPSPFHGPPMPYRPGMPTQPYSPQMKNNQNQNQNPPTEGFPGA